MAYTKQTFVNNSTVLTAEMMNHIEDGIVENENKISQLSADLIVTEGGDTLTWDGNTEGLVNVFEMYFKVSDAAPTMDDFVSTEDSSGDWRLEHSKEGAMVIGADEIQVVDDVLMVGFFVFSVPAELAGVELANLGVTFPEGGTYFANTQDGVTLSLTIPGYTGFETTTLKPSALPEHAHSWNELTDKPFGEADTVLVNEMLAFSNGVAQFATNNKPIPGSNTTVEWGGTTYICTAFNYSGFSGVGNLAIFEEGEDTGEPFLILWISDTGAQAFTTDAADDIAVKITCKTIVKLAKKYYETQSMLYTDGIYLYADAGMSTKLTSWELINIVQSSPTLVYMSGMLVQVLSVGMTEGVGYASVCHDDGFYTYYTAEYTAPE